MRIPAHLQQISKQLALRSWVKSSKCARETHFESIDIFKARIFAHQSDGQDSSDNDELLVTMIGAALNAEGALLTHALDKGTCDLDGPDQWSKVCLAAGWAVLQNYEHACSNGDWPHEH
jgi:hypothetical protein